jgi:hypothetical protein
MTQCHLQVSKYIINKYYVAVKALRIKQAYNFLPHRLPSGDRGIGFHLLTGTRDFSFLHSVQTYSEAYPSSYPSFFTKDRAVGA